MRRRDAYLEFLETVPLFAACTKQDLKRIAQAGTDIDVRQGAALTEEGRTGHEFFVIVNGRVGIYKGDKKMKSLGPGEFFGEMSLLDPAPRNATVLAEVPTQLIVLDRRAFTALLDQVPRLAHKLLKGLAQRLREVDSRRVN